MNQPETWPTKNRIVFDNFKSLYNELGQTIIALTPNADVAKASDRTIETREGEIEKE